MKRRIIMKTFKKILCVILALITALSFSVFAFAEETPAEEIPALEGLDTSAIDGKETAYVGVETYVVIYPMPDEAYDRFDFDKIEVVCSEEGIIETRTEKGENRYGSVLIKGIKTGKTTLTVTDTESGLSCSVEVTVRPAFFYKLQNFFINIQYVPFYIFVAILKLFGKNLYE